MNGGAEGRAGSAVHGGLRSPADGAMLLEPQGHVTLDRLKAQAQQDARASSFGMPRCQV